MRLLFFSLSLLLLISCKENAPVNNQLSKPKKSGFAEVAWKGRKVYTHPRDSTFEIVV